MTQPTPADDFETNDGDVNDNGNACDIDDSETLVPVPAKYYFNPYFAVTDSKFHEKLGKHFKEFKISKSDLNGNNQTDNHCIQ